MEPIIDGQTGILINHINCYAKTGEIFDMKNLISCFVLDVLSDVAFGQPFNAQMSGHADKIPAINEHILLSCLIGDGELEGDSLCRVRMRMPRGEE